MNCCRDLVLTLNFNRMFPSNQPRSIRKIILLTSPEIRKTFHELSRLSQLKVNRIPNLILIALISMLL